MSQPQSDDEVQAFVTALREAVADPLLDVIWQPRAFLVEHGTFDVYGQRTGEVYAKRWQIIRRCEATKTNDWKGYEVVCTVTNIVQMGEGLEGMSDEGEYMPLGERLLTFMRHVNEMNRRSLTERMEQLERIEAREEASRASTESEADLEGMYREFFRGTMEGGVSEFHPVAVQLK